MRGRSRHRLRVATAAVGLLLVLACGAAAAVAVGGGLVTVRGTAMRAHDFTEIIERTVTGATGDRGSLDLATDLVRPG